MSRFSNLARMVNARSLRERVIMTAALAAVTLVGFSEILWSPAYTVYAAGRLQLAHHAAAQATQLATLGALKKQAAEDPDAALRAQNVQLREELSRRDAELRARVSQLVKPAEVVDLLQAVLAATDGVSLVTLEHLSVERVFGGVDAEEVALYRHRVRLEFDAGFFATRDYLSSLEALGAQLIFRELRYRVEAHPIARVTLIVETLGMDKEWIGV